MGKFKEIKRAIEKAKKTREEQKEQESSGKSSKTPLKIFSAISMYFTQIGLVGIGIAINMVIAAVAIIAVIVTVVMAVATIVGTLSNLTYDDTPVAQTAGAQYKWNIADLNKMPDEWSKNLYRLAWLADANKKEQSSDMSMALLLGLPVSETSSNFFPTGSDHGVGRIDGTGKNWNDYSIAEYATVGGSFPWNTTYDYITGLYAIDAKIAEDKSISYTWGGIPRNSNEKLKTDTLGSRHESYIRQYAGKDVENSVYSVAYATAYTINMYNSYQKTILTEDANYGYTHKYKKYWEKAAEKYGLDANDTKTQTDIYNMLYYLIHAGGVWGFEDIADDFYYMALDYVAYTYKYTMHSNAANIRLNTSFSEKDSVRCINGNTLRIAARGDENVNHDGATAWYDPKLSTSILDAYGTNGWESVSNSLVGSWMTYNKENYGSDGEKLCKTYEKAYLHDNKLLVRQATYAVSTGITTIAAGRTRLDYIFKTLGIEYTINSQGYVCYIGGGTDSASGGHNGGDFSGSMSDKYKGYSNVRDNSWFATLNNAEWTDPLDKNKNGGITLTSRYGYRYLDAANPWDWHSGVDLVYTNRSSDLNVLRASYPVLAMHDCEVVKVNNNVSSSAGRYIHYKVTYTRSGKQVTNYITYMHLSKIADGVAVGKSYPKGTVLGYMGGSGNSKEFGYAVHLHISLSANPNVAGIPGRMDIETELPFITQYNNYVNNNRVSGYLSQKPAYPSGPSAVDPNYKAS